jgi:hypothetical protein
MIDPLMIPMILTICISGLVSLVSQIQHSSCTTISTPCCSCIRKVNDEQEPIVPFKNNMEELQNENPNI